MLTLEPAARVITFDCYGTLVQWHTALRQAARAILARRVDEREAGEQAAELADRLRDAAMARQQRPPFVDYRSVLSTSLTEALAATGTAKTAADDVALLSALRCIPAHPDTEAALRQLRSRYRLAIISNTDDDLIAETVEGIGVPIDAVITAQQARAYKPDHRLFHHAHAVLGVSQDETIHVGMGQVTDMKVCHELGIRSVWIDRMNERPCPDWPPHARLDDLSGLPELLQAN